MDSYKELMEKTERIVKDKKLDLSSDEDLSLGVMNLISIEEHLHFTAQKTGKDFYYEMLREVRNMRKVFLKKLIRDYEGEVWCTSKHLLSASMRLMETGTKHLDKGDLKEAKFFFENSYNLYSLFWAVNIESNSKEKTAVRRAEKRLDEANRKPSTGEELEAGESKTFFGNIREFVKKAVDCCKE
jgi:hypothetical protein